MSTAIAQNVAPVSTGPQSASIPKDAGTPLLSVRELRMAYSGSAEILKGISFSVPEGDSVALLGHNGSGKSTLLKCCMGLEVFQHGSISLLGATAHGTKSREKSKSRRELSKARAQVGFVFQHHNLVPRLSVLSNVIHGELALSRSPRLWFQGAAPQRVRDKAMEILDQVGLAAFAGSRADQLSGGQSQRVAIARALMQEPKVVLADEPVASLDPQAGEDVMNVLSGLCKQRGVTLVFSTHHLSHCKSYADRVVALKKGSLILDVPSSEANVEDLRVIYE